MRSGSRLPRQLRGVASLALVAVRIERGAILLASRLAQPAAALLAGPDEDQHATAPVVARPYRVVPVVLALHGLSTVGAGLHW